MKPQMIVGMIGLALAVVFGYHDVYQRQQAQVRLIQTQITDEHTKQQTQQEVATLQQQVEQYRHRLLEKPEPSILVREVAVLAKKAGVQLTTISQEAPQDFPQFTKLAVTLQFSASYHQLGTFLDYLEHAHHFIRADTITVHPTAGGTPAISLLVSTLALPPVPDHPAG